MNDNIELIATSAAGLESLVKKEVYDLGFDDISVENGKITFKGTLESIPMTNIWLRSADRVYVKIGEFKALSFEELFESTKKLPWDEWIAKNGEFTVVGKSVKSKLFSISDCQSIIKKSVVEKLRNKYNIDWFEENGPKYTIHFSILKDNVILSIDTSGIALHKRGYRYKHVVAPLKETMAAALINISYWKKDKPFIDPFCGTGTLPIEAALIGRNIAPGMNRKFASSDWPIINKKYWDKEFEFAKSVIDYKSKLEIYASDVDQEAIELAKNSAKIAGVYNDIVFKRSDFRQVTANEKYGIIICNPPYGERLGEIKIAEKIYEDMGNVFEGFKTWSKYILTPCENFEKIYGKKANKKRKLYNGQIKVDYYQFYGIKPEKIINRNEDDLL